MSYIPFERGQSFRLFPGREIEDPLTRITYVRRERLQSPIGEWETFYFEDWENTIVRVRLNPNKILTVAEGTIYYDWDTPVFTSLMMVPEPPEGRGPNVKSWLEEVERIIADKKTRAN